VDAQILGRKAEWLKGEGTEVATYGDLRRVFDAKDVDAVVVATPNHWHALATVWGCQAGKDVYVEKPISHGIWEGRQMVAAARRHERVVQSGTQARSSPVMKEAVEWLQRGELGAIRFARIVLYRRRESIGKVSEPTPIPAHVDYDLWCGPVEPAPLRRKQLHYDWHWDWATGSGEMGNNGVHYIDLCRWFLKLGKPAPRVMSVGGRFGYDDDGETPNTQVAMLEFEPAPVYCEIRALPAKAGAREMDAFGDTRVGVVIECEGGTLSGAHLNMKARDRDGKLVKEFGPIPWEIMDTAHMANFVEAVRTRDAGSLNADVLEGHLSAACCHQVNLSHRLGQAAAPGEVGERAKADPVYLDAVERCHEHLKANGVDFSRSEILGPWLSFDAEGERFVGDFSSEANTLLRRADREPFAVPALA
jgi:predicted dehydrogenase